MKRLALECGQTELLPSEGRGYALAVTLTSVGDEPAPVSGVFLARIGINVLPEFAEGFGFDASNVIPGLAPDDYQFRIEMLLSHKGKLLYGNGKSEFQLRPSKSVKFVMPIPFNWINVFMDAPPEDLRIIVASLNEDDVLLECPELQPTIQRAFREHGHLGRPYNLNINIKVPMSKPPSEEELARHVGTVNTKPIRPMPNT